MDRHRSHTKPYEADDTAICFTALASVHTPNAPFDFTHVYVETIPHFRSGSPTTADGRKERSRNFSREPGTEGNPLPVSRLWITLSKPP